MIICRKLSMSWEDNMKKIFPFVLIIICFTFSAHAAVKVKVRDIADIDGFKENQLFGYGLIVGLPATGDSRSPLAESTLKNLLMNLNLDGSDKINTKNVAAVLVTAKLPPYAKIGDRVDVVVSSIGDAKSLEGGMLVQSPLRGGDDRIYLVAQGPLSFDKGEGKNRQVKTVARVINGGLVERELEGVILPEKNVVLILREFDFTTAENLIKTLTENYPAINAKITNGGKIDVAIPDGMRQSEFISKLLEMEVEPASMARVVINEKDGTIVLGGDVRISQVMVSRSGITVKIEGKDESKIGNALLIKDTATVKDLVETLNKAGISTSDTISILKSMKDAGALHAELIVR